LLFRDDFLSKIIATALAGHTHREILPTHAQPRHILARQQIRAAKNASAVVVSSVTAARRVPATPRSTEQPTHRRRPPRQSAHREAQRVSVNLRTHTPDNRIAIDHGDERAKSPARLNRRSHAKSSRSAAVQSSSRATRQLIIAVSSHDARALRPAQPLLTSAQ
jgi:hypothetical protein